MKKFTALAVLLTLTACGNGYESLNTPFEHRGKGINLFGSDAAPASNGQSNTFEVVVNAPAGVSEAVAQDLFDQEGKRVCSGREFTKQITSSGTARVREYGVKGVTTSTFDTQAPSLRGYVTCQD